MQELVQWKSRKYYKFSVCICTLRYSVWNVHEPYCHLHPAWFCNIFSHYHISGTIFGGGALNMKLVFWFSLQILSESFWFEEELSEMCSKIKFALHVKDCSFLSDFNETWIILTDLRKILNIIFYQNPYNCNLVVPCRQTNGQTWQN